MEQYGERFMTAIHEAGHLVMADSMGVELWGVSIGDSSGVAFHDPRGTDAQNVMISMAGGIAAMIAGQDSAVANSVSRSDGEKAYAAMQRGTTASSAQEYALTVKKTLIERWPAVVLLATKIDERGAVTGDECKNIIGRALVKTYRYTV